MDDASPAGNTPEFTVSELSGAIKRTLEGAFERVRVRGEISAFKRHGSGHAYFCLKDEGARLDGVIWRSAFARLGLAPEDGMEVVATGRITGYGDRSTYQLVVERLEYAGLGALLARIEQLRLRMMAEGLFAPERKRPIPLLPSVIGVVTSESGAVVRDIITTVARRFPRPILLWPVPVQGEDAPRRIVAAIRGLNALPPAGEAVRPDVLIVGRGGGSLEDLMAFNDEAVVRAVAASAIPVIAAVGHETDTTLVDFAADRRAPTPTAAAEFAVPLRADLIGDLQQRGTRLLSALNAAAQSSRLRLHAVERRMPDLPGIVQGARQRLDDRGSRLLLALPNAVAGHAARLAAGGRLPNPAHPLGQKRASLAPLRVGLDSAMRARLGALAARLALLSARIDAVSPLAVLGRGYALVLDRADLPVTSARGLRPGTPLRLRFADGDVRARVEPGVDARQGSLPV